MARLAIGHVRRSLSLNGQGGDAWLRGGLMPGQAGNGVSLADAVERYRRLPGACGNAYDWYRRSAARNGRVSLGATTVSAWKQGRQWMLDSDDVERALAVHEERIAERKRVTEAYAAHVLHGGDGGSIETDWGGYRIRRDFHFAWSDYARVTRAAVAPGTATPASHRPGRSAAGRSATPARTGAAAAGTVPVPHLLPCLRDFAGCIRPRLSRGAPGACSAWFICDGMYTTRRLASTVKRPPRRIAQAQDLDGTG